MNHSDEDDQPVTRARLKIELEHLRNELETERLKRQTAMQLQFVKVLTFIVWTSLIAAVVCSIINRVH